MTSRSTYVLVLGTVHGRFPIPHFQIVLCSTLCPLTSHIPSLSPFLFLPVLSWGSIVEESMAKRRPLAKWLFEGGATALTNKQVCAPVSRRPCVFPHLRLFPVHLGHSLSNCYDLHIVVLEMLMLRLLLLHSISFFPQAPFCWFFYFIFFIFHFSSFSAPLILLFYDSIVLLFCVFLFFFIYLRIYLFTFSIWLPGLYRAHSKWCLGQRVIRRSSKQLVLGVKESFLK